RSAKLDEVLLRALSREPAKRYATAQEMATDIAACISPATAAEVGAWVRSTAGDSLASRAETATEIVRTSPGAAPSRLRRSAFLVISAAGATALAALALASGTAPFT